MKELKAGDKCKVFKKDGTFTIKYFSYNKEGMNYFCDRHEEALNKSSKLSFMFTSNPTVYKRFEKII
jgi:hypothetical protein